MNRMFVDASAWVGVFSSDDARFEPAMSFWESFPARRLRPITTDYVLDETYTLLRRRRNGLNRARNAYRVIEEMDFVELLHVEEADRQEGWRLFNLYQDKVISFTDCVSFGMMRQLGLNAVFTFDLDFTRAGFDVWPRLGG